MHKEPALGTCEWCGVHSEWERLWWMTVDRPGHGEYHYIDALTCNDCWSGVCVDTLVIHPDAQIFCRVP